MAHYMQDLLYPFHITVSSAVIHFWKNVPVLGSPSDVHMRSCESVANRPLPCVSYQSFEIFEVSASDFGTVRLCR